MDLYNKLPDDIKTKIFMFFIHPTAAIIKLNNSPRGKLMADIQDYSRSLNKLYKLSFAQDHSTSPWGRPRLINSLWMYAHTLLGSYYDIWRRMYRVKSTRNAEWWIRHKYAVNSHDFQINTLWALFTISERQLYFQRFGDE